MKALVQVYTIADVPHLFSSMKRLLPYEWKLGQQSWFPSLSQLSAGDWGQRLSYTNKIKSSSFSVTGLDSTLGLQSS